MDVIIVNTNKNTRMKQTQLSLRRISMLLLLCLSTSFLWAAVNPKPFVVPELKQWTGKEGHFTPETHFDALITLSEHLFSVGCR